MTMMKPSEVLARSQEVLLERGLAKNESIVRTAMSPWANVCSGTAIAIAAGARVLVTMGENCVYPFPTINRQAVGRATYYLLRVVGGSSVVIWNDTPELTLEEALDAFHKAEILAKENGE